MLLATGCGLVSEVGLVPDGAGAPSATGTAAPTAPATSPATTLAGPPPVQIVRDHIAYDAPRQDQMAGYAQRHYGLHTALLEPSLIVLHFTESEDYASVRSHFAANEPNMGELPGVCAHYVVEQNGTVHELVPPDVMCRHTVGLNHLAIGIEFVQSSQGNSPTWAVRQVLARAPQMSAGLALVQELQERYGIATAGVIGHAMANETAGFRDLRGWRNDHVDWQEREVTTFRKRLAAR